MKKWGATGFRRGLERGDLIDISPYEPFEDLAESIREVENASRGRGLGAFRIIQIPRKAPPKRRRESRLRSYSERKVFTAHALSLMGAAERIVSLIPEPLPPDHDWRCHEVARAIGSRLRLEVVDGHFGGVEHSWLEIVDGCLDRTTAILDVYAVGSLPQVRLLDRRSPEGILFEPGRERADVRYEDVAALANVLDPCEHTDGFQGRTRGGESFCERCGKIW